MRKPLISIIVPVYNVEKYLPQCLDSIMVQTYTNLEIILVDDGSTDNGGHICDEYAKSDSRIKVIHKQNAGLSAARNLGLDIAHGEYIGFVDSDDWIEPTMYEDLYAGFSITENTLLTNGMIYQYDDITGEELLMRPHSWKRESLLVINGADFGKAMFSETSNHYAWSKLYRREVFDWVRFREGRNDEDTLFTYDLSKILRKTSHNIVEIVSAIYHYRQRHGSICLNKSNPLIKDRIQNLNEIFDDVQNSWPELEKYIQERKLMSLWWYVLNALKDSAVPRSQWKPYQKLLRKTCPSDAKRLLSKRGYLQYLIIRAAPYVLRYIKS